MDGPLKLRVRSKELPSAETAKLRQRTLKSWLKDLPMASVGETGRLVYQMLRKINEANLPPGDRYKLVSMLRPPTDYVFGALHQQYFSRSEFLSETERKVASLGPMLQDELSIGYFSVIEDMLSGSGSRFDNKLILYSAARAIEALSKIQVAHLQLYSAPPEQLWREVCQIYLFIEKNQLADINLRKRGPVKITIASIFKRLILMAMADPFQLPSQHTDILFRHVNQWSDLCEIKPFHAEHSGIVINLNSGEGPRHRGVTSSTPTPTWRLIDVDPLLATLQNDTSIELEENLPNKLIRHLLRVWGAVSKRSFPRVNYSAQVELSFGLGASHFMLETQEEESATPLNKAPKTDILSTLSFEDDDPHLTENRLSQRSLDAWDRTNYSVGADRFQKGKTIIDDIGGKPRYSKYNGNVVNISPGGYRIAIDRPFPKGMQVGEIVSLRESAEDNSPPSWNIGIIRWLKQTASDLSIGVQLLAPNASPIKSKIISKKIEGEYLRGLLLPAIRGIGQEATLITPTVYKTDDKLYIKLESKQISVRLVKEVASNTTYKQFEFERVELEKEAPLSPKKAVNLQSNSSDDIDKLWSLI
jgi:hypothetical protein|tara:strand:- start:2082 stop:3845 length:1764 start_codon:yes stop_codon:yes gene_type:complete